MYLPVPFRLIFLIFSRSSLASVSYACFFIGALGSCGALVDHAGEPHFSDKVSLPLHQTIYDENNRTFAVSPLASSSWSTPPMPNVYYSPSSCEPTKHVRVWAALLQCQVSALDGKRAVRRDASHNDLPLDV